jgi:hypothetical protein
VEPNARDERLLALLQQHHGAKGRKSRILIFVLYKKVCGCLGLVCPTLCGCQSVSVQTALQYERWQPPQHTLHQQVEFNVIHCATSFSLQHQQEAPRVEGLLKRRGWDAAAVHGDISQAQRTAAVDAFKAGTCPLLIATGEERGGGGGCLD